MAAAMAMAQPGGGAGGSWGFAAERSTNPLAGLTSGHMASGMNFNKVGRGTPIMALVAQPPPSPLQQWYASEQPRLPPGYQEGMPVRIVHMLSHETQRYNGLIGDIGEVQTMENDDGTQELFFEVRCPVRLAGLRNLVDEQEYYKKPFSPAAQKAAAENRARITGTFGSGPPYDEADDPRLPPIVLLSRLPSEKLEPLNNAASASLAAARGGILHSFDPAAAAGGGGGAKAGARLPGMSDHPAPWVLEPKWGAPLPLVMEEEMPTRAYQDGDEDAYNALARSYASQQPQARPQSPGSVACSERFAPLGTAPMASPPVEDLNASRASVTSAGQHYAAASAAVAAASQPLPVTSRGVAPMEVPVTTSIAPARYIGTVSGAPMSPPQTRSLTVQSMQPGVALAPPPAWDGPPTPPLSGMMTAPQSTMPGHPGGASFGASAPASATLGATSMASGGIAAAAARVSTLPAGAFGTAGRIPSSANSPSALVPSTAKAAASAGLASFGSVSIHGGGSPGGAGPPPSMPRSTSMASTNAAPQVTSFYAVQPASSSFAIPSYSQVPPH